MKCVSGATRILSFGFIAVFTMSVGALPGDFLRADANDDGQVDMSDAITILLGGPFSCLEAANANNKPAFASAAVDNSDAVYLLMVLFMNGLPPHTPFPGCGPQPTGLPSAGCVSSLCF